MAEARLSAMQDTEQLDPAVLSTLPQSMQFDLLLKMRERLQTANREQFAARQGLPAEFSLFQMKSFLKVAEHKCVRQAFPALNLHLVDMLDAPRQPFATPLSCLCI